MTDRAQIIEAIAKVRINRSTILGQVIAERVYDAITGVVWPAPAKPHVVDGAGWAEAAFDPPQQPVYPSAYWQQIGSLAGMDHDADGVR